MEIASLAGKLRKGRPGHCRSLPLLYLFIWDARIATLAYAVWQVSKCCANFQHLSFPAYNSPRCLYTQLQSCVCMNHPSKSLPLGMGYLACTSLSWCVYPGTLLKVLIVEVKGSPCPIQISHHRAHPRQTHIPHICSSCPGGICFLRESQSRSGCLAISRDYPRGSP